MIHRSNGRSLKVVCRGKISSLQSCVQRQNINFTKLYSEAWTQLYNVVFRDKNSTCVQRQKLNLCSEANNQLVFRGKNSSCVQRQTFNLCSEAKTQIVFRGKKSTCVQRQKLNLCSEANTQLFKVWFHENDMMHCLYQNIVYLPPSHNLIHPFNQVYEHYVCHLTFPIRPPNNREICDIEVLKASEFSSLPKTIGFSLSSNVLQQNMTVIVFDCYFTTLTRRFLLWSNIIWKRSKIIWFRHN